MFAFTAANHLGLVGKMESLIRHRLPVVNCPMCATFWSTLAYMLYVSRDVIGAVAMSFLFAYMAIWLELTMCVADHFYTRIYEKFVSSAGADKAASGPFKGDASGSVS